HHAVDVEREPDLLGVAGHEGPLPIERDGDAEGAVLVRLPRAERALVAPRAVGGAAVDDGEAAPPLPAPAVPYEEAVAVEVAPEVAVGEAVEAGGLPPAPPAVALVDEDGALAAVPLGRGGDGEAVAVEDGPGAEAAGRGELRGEAPAPVAPPLEDVCGAGAAHRRVPLRRHDDPVPAQGDGGAVSERPQRVGRMEASLLAPVPLAEAVEQHGVGARGAE